MLFLLSCLLASSPELLPSQQAPEPTGSSQAEVDLNALWPQWRGPTRDGRFHGPEWPAELADEVLELEWRVELDDGYSGPIVAGDRVFTVETREKSSEVVRAFDRKSGEALWKASWEGSMKVPFFHAKGY